MNIQNKHKLRSQVSTTSAPSLFPASSATSLTGTDSGSLPKTPNEPRSAPRLQPDNLLITKSTSSLLATQQERISSALKLKRRNLFVKSASEDSDLQQESSANLQADVRSPAHSAAQFASGSAAHQTIRWKRFLQMRRGKSVCSESVTDLSSSSLTSSFTVTSTETEHDSSLKVSASGKPPARGKPPLYSTQSTQSLTNKPDTRFASKLIHKSTNKSDNRLNKPDARCTDGASDTTNLLVEATGKVSEPGSASSSTAIGFGATGFARYHKKRRSRKGSYRSNLRGNHGALTSQYFRTSFDSAVSKRNAALNLHDTSRACSFDNACLASASLNYSNQTISSLGIGYLIDDVHQLSLDDNER